MGWKIANGRPTGRQAGVQEAGGQTTSSESRRRSWPADGPRL